MPTIYGLNGKNWLFKGFYGEDWRWRNVHQPGSLDYKRGWNAASVPGSVLNDLLQAGLIQNPYYEQNSLLVEWAAQRNWVYRTHFLVEPEWQNRQVQLVFEGVDYQAEFFLNGKLLGEHAGMYSPVRFDASHFLNFEGENLLVVVIAAAPAEQPQVGRTSRVRTMKARMNYWWDFCPRMVHQGIWQDVYLQVNGPVRLEDVFVRSEVSDPLDHAAVSVECLISSQKAMNMDMEVILHSSTGVVGQAHLAGSLNAGDNRLTVDIHLDRPELWWPNGYGNQSLYTAEVSLCGAGEVESLDRREVSFGIRRVRFVSNQDASADALPYTLEVNGVRIFAKGWNWVPMDALYGVENPDKLERLLRLAVQAGTNLLRVWGGGLIERESFYNLCDHLGLLVWQEFIQSSSGIDNCPPVDADFIAWTIAEVRKIIPLRRNHPSLAIWCGGNELMDEAKSPLNDNNPMLAALHAQVTELDPGRAWLPTSSSGPVFGNGLAEIDKDPMALHDVHGPWEYQGVEAQYTLYNRGCSLLHSEFGVEGITNLRALNAVMAAEHQFPVNRDNPVWFHLGAWWVKEEMWQNTFGSFLSIEEAVRGTQFLQFEGLRYALEADRRRWPHNSGVLPWQFNEPFPMAACTSAVDYFAEPKPAYEAVRKAYEALHVSARYPTVAWAGRDLFEADLWLDGQVSKVPVSSTLVWKVTGTDELVYHQGNVPVTTETQHPVCLAEVRCPLADILGPLFFLDLSLQEPDGQVCAHNRYLFSTTQNLAPIFDLLPAVIEVEVIKKDENMIEVGVSNHGVNTAFYLWFENAHNLIDYRYVYFSQNYFCLFPGESKTIQISQSGKDILNPELFLSGWNVAKTPIR